MKSQEAAQGFQERHAAARDLAARHWRLSIGGRLADATSGRTFSVTSPIDGAQIAEVPDADADDVARAVDAASGALRDWRRRSVATRAELVLELADAIDARAEELALLDVLDCGATITKMREDVDMAARRMRHFAGIAGEVKGHTVPVGAGLHFTEYEPYGVVARIIPFNHPLMFAATKIVAPLLMGNTVVLKPAEATPLSALLLGELAADILPDGVLSVLVGDGPACPRALVRHELVRRIGFTGSEPTGRAIQRDAADVGVKDVTLELGGKNALIAFPDADPDEVAAAAIQGMNFSWAGQSCGSTSRLLLHSSIRAAVLERVAERVGRITGGSPFDSGTQFGAIASRAQFERVTGYIELGLAEGAHLFCGGQSSEADSGYFVAPTVLTDVAPTSRLGQEEVFGPVLSVMTWETEEEAIRIANSVRYGLTASVWTNDIRRAHRVAREMEAGFVWINGVGQHFMGVPYGGFKNSGVGREESIEELESYGQIKATNVYVD